MAFAIPNIVCQMEAKKAMKTVSFLIVSGVLCGSALAQSGGTAPSSSPLRISDHPEHASQTTMGQSQDLLEHSGMVSAHGELPLWELMPPKTETPLGDVARALRKEHAADKKATKIWTDLR